MPLGPPTIHPTQAAFSERPQDTYFGSPGRDRKAETLGSMQNVRRGVRSQGFSALRRGPQPSRSWYARGLSTVPINIPPSRRTRR
jgi:hypothetical protein